jgi:hypothetical protein
LDWIQFVSIGRDQIRLDQKNNRYNIFYYGEIVVEMDRDIHMDTDIAIDMDLDIDKLYHKTIDSR